jgi:PST family polysaccharide transporter
VALGTAVAGWGGMAIVAGNVARSFAKAVAMTAAVDRREWLEPCPIRRDVARDIFAFGLPLAIATIAGYAAVRWDNLLVSRFFGPSVMAAYNIAYNLAGLAPGLVLDQVLDVLVPSFARTAPERRRDGLLRGAELVALIATPLCLGVAVVAPTLVATVLDARWASAAPMLAILSAAAVFAPLQVLAGTFLQGSGRPVAVMTLALVALAAIMSSVGTVGRLGPLWTCGAVGLAALLNVLVAAYAVRRAGGPEMRPFLATLARPLLAAAPMVGAVLAARWLLSSAGVAAGATRLVVEVAAGAVAYPAAALLVARRPAAELVRLLQAALARRRAPAALDAGG